MTAMPRRPDLGSEAIKETIDALERNSGKHPGYRRAQARGVCLKGVFTPSGEAAGLTQAAHLRDEAVPVTVRFSDSDGNPAVSDAGFVAHGLTVRFHLPDGSDTDLIALSLPVFIAATPQDFIEVVDALQPDPETHAPDPARLGAYIKAHPRTAASFTAVDVPPPVSYGTVGYRALHAYIWVGPAGQRQAVRYRWEPAAGVAALTDQEAAARAPDYLTQEILERVVSTPVTFTLHVQLAADGDPTNDSTVAWPDDRPEIVAGRLVLTAPVEDPEHWNAEGFDPTRTTPGIELSDDPLLAFRAKTYAESHRRRSSEH
jgi:catalase